MKRAPFIVILTKTFIVWNFRARHANRDWITALCKVGILTFVFGSHSPAFANQELTKTPWSLLEEHRAQILKLASDDEALTFFHSLTKDHGKGSRTRIKSQSSQTGLNSEDMRGNIITYLASLAVTAHTQAIRNNIGGTTMTGSPSTEAVGPGEAQLQWMINHSPHQTLKSVMAIYTQVSAWSENGSPPAPSEKDFANFASYYDHTYPLWDDSPISWIHLFKQEGMKGVESRLHEYWQVADHQAIKDKIPEANRQAYARLYIGTRLLPLFRANLLMQIFRLEASAYDHALENWNHIQRWQEKKQTKLAILRLCGTWRWIVHNHQNHGDHKMTLTFSPPDQSSPSQPEPTTISIQGDTVYLKWTFPQGVQEDSLLLSNHDTHLEGTFKNSLGPHGSISGKRLTSCPS